jgi:hypothetical protein
MTYMTRQQWRDYARGYVQAKDLHKITNVLHRWIDTYLKESIMKIKILEEMQMKQQSSSQDEEKEKIGTLLRRWNQIKGLCENTLTALSKV